MVRRFLLALAESAEDDYPDLAAWCVAMVDLIEPIKGRGR